MNNIRYDFDTLYIEAGDNAFAGGKKRFYDNKVSRLAYVPEADKHKISAVVSGRDEYETEIVFDGSGGLYDYCCTCSVFSPDSGPCKHIVAAALSFEDRFPQKAAVPGAASNERSDGIALSLSSEYSKRRRTRYICQEGEKVRLEPVLLLKDDRFALRFMIGRGRMYLLKDISDFVSAIQSVGYRRYGAELELDHNIENFNAKSRELINFLTASYAEKAELFSAVKAQNLYRDELLLISGDADDFFDMFEGGAVAFDEKNMRDGVRLLMPGVNTLDYKLIVEKISGGYNVYGTLSLFRQVNGKRGSYIVTDSRIFRVSRDFAATLMPLLKSLNQVKKMFIAASDMPFFYNNVIAAAQGYVAVESAEDLSVFEAPPFVAKIYLSSGAAPGLKCDVSVSYDDAPVNIFDDNFAADFVRDWETERGFKNVLGKYFPDFPDLEIRNEDDLYFFLSGGIAELFNYADIYMEESIKKMKIKKPPRMRVGVRLESGLLNIDLSAEDFSADELKAVLAAYRDKKNYVRLTDGSFVDLTDANLRTLAEAFEISGGTKQNFSLPAYYAPYLNSMLKEGSFTLERDSEFKQLIQKLKNVRDLDIEVPDALKSIMRNYQKTGFRWLKTLSACGFGGILADDMGLGKSLQVISLLMDEKTNNPSIIVCPTTLVLNWVNEFIKFAPQMKVLAVTGTSDERREKLEQADNFDVIITSYELIRRDEELYKDLHFDFAIIDEAQYIKNPETKNARAVKKLNAPHRFALTGTPVENSLAELWSIFDFVMPGYLYSYSKFRDRFESGIAAGEAEPAAKLKKLVEPFILRRLKSAVLTELPPKVETMFEVPLEDEQKKLYLATLSLIKENVRAAGENINKVVVLSLLTKLRQICCEPRLAYTDYAGNSAKLDACLEILTGAVESGHKVLLFSQFTSMLEIIKQRLIESGLSFFVLKGDTPKAERMRLVTRFNNNDTNVFLISLKAGGTGLNLTGADVVIHYDPWWNESVMNQATDRAYRIGQDKSVQVYKIILKNTIEEKILILQKKKAALSDLIESGEGAANMSYSDILSILEE